MGEHVQPCPPSARQATTITKQSCSGISHWRLLVGRQSAYNNSSAGVLRFRTAWVEHIGLDKDAVDDLRP